MMVPDKGVCVKGGKFFLLSYFCISTSFAVFIFCCTRFTHSFPVHVNPSPKICFSLFCVSALDKSKKEKSSIIFWAVLHKNKRQGKRNVKKWRSDQGRNTFRSDFTSSFFYKVYRPYFPSTASAVVPVCLAKDDTDPQWLDTVESFRADWFISSNI